MKIGILSMQRIKNYGSFLQAYGLKGIIESLGHEVVFVDYQIEKCIVDSNDNINPVHKKIIRELKYILRRLYIYVRQGKNKGKKLEVEYNNYLKLLGITDEYKYRTKVDTLVIGSDEVFNCLQTNKDVGYSKELFGENNKAKRLISYAASCGTTTIEGLEKYKIKEEVSSLLRKFDAISVRDNNTGKVVKELTGKEPYYNLDPVFMYNYDELIPKSIDLKDYVVVYAYSNRITLEEGKYIRDFAKKHNKKLVCIGAEQKCCEICLKANPFELLAYIKNADYVITDTFHGSVFSIKYNKLFATIIRNSNKQKLSDLLNRFDLSSREVSDMNKLEDVLVSDIKYDKVNEFLDKEINKTIKYLKENL
ncbi:MAG: polysaccharide pyruvyl transferase family protein [Clostridiales bacterium]|nr:polysaccharide pyruvyl transferase family protein [Clostridiales bacterium]